MARYHFPLERVLRFKELRERQAETREMQALAEVRRQEANVAALLKQIEGLADSARARLGQGLDLSAWLAAQRSAEQLGRELLAAEARVKHAAQRWSEARLARRRAALEAEALRQLRRRRVEQFEEAAARAEQVALDEIGLRRWLSADEE